MDGLSTRDVPEGGFQARRLGHVNLYVGIHLDRFIQTSRVLSWCGEPARCRSFPTVIPTTMRSCSAKVRCGRDVALRSGASFRGEVPGLNHLAWEMHSEAVLVDKLKAGIGGLEIKFSADHLISHSAYIEDPEGNITSFTPTRPIGAQYSIRSARFATADWDCRISKHHRAAAARSGRQTPCRSGVVPSTVCHTRRFAVEDPELIDVFLTTSPFDTVDDGRRRLLCGGYGLRSAYRPGGIPATASLGFRDGRTSSI